MQTLKKNRVGFSLTEAMLATVVLGIAAAGILLPFASGASLQNEGANRTLAVKLASDLMEEILTKPFDQIIGSFGSYSEPYGHVKDSEGGTLSGGVYNRLSRDSNCVYFYTAQESGAGSPRFILASVRVYDNGRQIAEVRRLISK